MLNTVRLCRFSLCMFAVGCNAETTTTKNESTPVVTKTEVKKEAQVKKTDSNEKPKVEKKEATSAKSPLARFQSKEDETAVDAATVKRVSEFLVGTWHSKDAASEPLVFEADGTFTCGFLRENGKWLNAKGKWAVKSDTRVTATAQHKGIMLGLHYTIRNGELHAPRGPVPDVTWIKDESTK